MPSPSVSTVPSRLSGMPSPSLSRSYGSGRVVPSVFGGVKPPFVELGTPFASTVPSTLPSPSTSVPLDSLTSLIPSLSESGSKRFGIPSPSVSQSGAVGEQTPASTVSNRPSLSSSASSISYTPSLSVSTGQPFKFTKPTNSGH